MNKETELVKKYRAIAEDILRNNISPKLVYHTIDHTRSVVKAFIEIGMASGLSEKELELGTVAAWFHDTGYTKTTIFHEQKSIEIFNDKVSNGDFSAEDISTIDELIQGTRMPQQPTTMLGKVVCDADLHHLGTESFFEQSELLKKEMENEADRKIKKEMWNVDSYYFLRDHQFFTPYAKKTFGPKEEENLIELRGDIKEFTKQDKQIKGLESKLEKLNSKLLQKPSRGIETMFRITSRNHLQLSSMADSKANIMISINTILISVVMTVVGSRLADNPEMIMPLVFLMAVCLTTIVLAVLATRPSVSKGTFTRDDIMNKKTNLLFFGNFHGMDIDDYQWGVSEMMKDADYLYSSLTRDVFFLGKVLAKKYRMLRYAYTTFMVGFVISMLFFLFTWLLNNYSVFL
jgi:predicted metal-dependent HD superfamily phosphohydrolase